MHLQMRPCSIQTCQRMTDMTDFRRGSHSPNHIMFTVQDPSPKSAPKCPPSRRLMFLCFAVLEHLHELLHHLARFASDLHLDFGSHMDAHRLAEVSDGRIINS